MSGLTGSKELLTAGSKENRASGGLLPGQTALTTGAPGSRSYDSFTRVLIRELEALQDAKPFTARTLHMRLDMRDESGKRRLEHQPQLFTLAPSDDAIMLFPVPKIKAPVPQASSIGWILLSVQLSGSPPGDQPQGTDWLEYINKSISEGFREQVEIAAAFISNSTVLILSMPTDVWAFLPHDFAGSYIGQVKSGNLLLEQETTNELQSVFVSTPITVNASEIAAKVNTIQKQLTTLKQHFNLNIQTTAANGGGAAGPGTPSKPKPATVTKKTQTTPTRKTASKKAAAAAARAAAIEEQLKDESGEGMGRK
jgi:hypothetical protein